jgi:hypothetical protein
MAKSNVRLDYDELVKLKEQIERFGDATQVDLFLTSCAKELAKRLLAKVIKRTPVGDYSGNSYSCAGGQTHKGNHVAGKVGGTLRRGWTAGQSSNAQSYANSLTVNKVGNDYIIEIINPVEYASYVEFGHRTRNHKGWVEGHFMLTISEDEIRNSAPKILEQKLKKYLEGCFK